MKPCRDRITSKTLSDFLSSSQLNVDYVQHCKLLSPQQQQQVRAHPASKAMAAATMSRLDACNCRALANLAWAQAVMKLGPPEFMPQVCHQRMVNWAMTQRAVSVYIRYMRKGHRVGCMLDWKLLGANVGVRYASKATRYSSSSSSAKQLVWTAIANPSLCLVSSSTLVFSP